MTAPSICDVLPSAAALLGAADAPDPLELLPALGPARRVVLLLVDGMGLQLLPMMADRAPVLTSLIPAAGEVTGRRAHLIALECTMPSTTPTSLVSLTTGRQPGEHGILGFTVNVPGTNRVLTHITWRDDPDPRVWQPVPTWFERLAGAGVDCRAVLPSTFRRSGLTSAAYRGARFVGVRDNTQYARRLTREIRRGPGLIYGYLAALDTAAHVHGIASSMWQDAAGEVDALVAALVHALPDDAVLLITADHGGMDVPASARLDIAGDERLRAGLRVVAGEPRFRHLHVEPGAEQAVLRAWRDVLGTRAEVLTREQAITSGMFGDVAAQHRERIGDVVVVCDAETVVLASDREPDAISKLVGFHGARTPAETGIPLIAFTR